jgi:membrane protein DedA with SNARE-associated domain
MSQFLDRLEKVRGLPVLIGVALVFLNFVIRCAVYAFVPSSQDVGLVLFLFTDGNLLLHLGVIVGLLGILIGDIL